MPEIRGVLLDLDDTLYDEMTFVQAAMRNVAEFLAKRSSLESQQIEREMMAILREQGRGNVFDTWLDRNHTSERIRVRQLVEVYRSTEPRLELYPEAEEVLAELRSCGFLLGVITDGFFDVQARKIKALGLAEKVNKIWCTDEYGPGNWKPSPRPFRRALDKLGLQPEESVYVGNDVSKDFQGPRQIGMHAMHISRAGPCQEPHCPAGIHGQSLCDILDWAQGTQEQKENSL
jgi:putative hydrolase of the HAD superfamily